MNQTIIDFLEKNNVNVDDLVNDDRFTVLSCKEINPILDNYFIMGNSVKAQVSIADILGYQRDFIQFDTNLIMNLPKLFNREESGYLSRSVGMLEMDRETCIKVMKEICKIDTFYLRKCEENKYIVVTNGMHRYHALRFHYLNELSQIDQSDPEQLKALHEKYKVDVKIEIPDFNKTYAYYILKKLIPNIEVHAEYDRNRINTTGNAIVRLFGKETILTDEQLISLLKQEIERNPELFRRHFSILENRAEIIPSFEKFLKNHSISLDPPEVSV